MSASPMQRMVCMRAHADNHSPEQFHLERTRKQQQRVPSAVQQSSTNTSHSDWWDTSRPTDRGLLRTSFVHRNSSNFGAHLQLQHLRTISARPLPHRVQRDTRPPTKYLVRPRPPTLPVLRPSAKQALCSDQLLAPQSSPASASGYKRVYGSQSVRHPARKNEIELLIAKQGHLSAQDCPSVNRAAPLPEEASAQISIDPVAPWVAFLSEQRRRLLAINNLRLSFRNEIASCTDTMVSTLTTFLSDRVNRIIHPRTHAYVESRSHGENGEIRNKRVKLSPEDDGLRWISPTELYQLRRDHSRFSESLLALRDAVRDSNELRGQLNKILQPLEPVLLYDERQVSRATWKDHNDLATLLAHWFEGSNFVLGQLYDINAITALIQRQPSVPDTLDISYFSVDVASIKKTKALLSAPRLHRVLGDVVELLMPQGEPPTADFIEQAIIDLGAALHNFPPPSFVKSADYYFKLRTLCGASVGKSFPKISIPGSFPGGDGSQSQTENGPEEEEKHHSNSEPAAPRLASYRATNFIFDRPRDDTSRQSSGIYIPGAPRPLDRDKVGMALNGLKHQRRFRPHKRPTHRSETLGNRFRRSSRNDEVKRGVLSPAESPPARSTSSPDISFSSDRASSADRSASPTSAAALAMQNLSVADRQKVFKDRLLSRDELVAFSPTQRTPRKSSVFSTQKRLQEQDPSDSINRLLSLPSERPLRMSDASKIDIEVQRKELELRIKREAERVAAIAKREAEEKARKELEARLAKSGGLRMPKQKLVTKLSDDWMERSELTLHAGTDAVLATTADGVNLSQHDFAKLVPSTVWLNDEIVNGTLGWLQQAINLAAGVTDVKKQTRKCLALSSLAVARIKEKRGEGTQRMLSRQGVTKQNLLNVESILVPICEGLHWTLLAIRPTHRTVCHIDSLRPDGRGNSYWTKLGLDWMKVILEERFVGPSTGDDGHHDDKENDDDENNNDNEDNAASAADGAGNQVKRKDKDKDKEQKAWQVVRVPAPAQTNGHDCGVHAVSNAMCVALGISPLESYASEEMPLQRLRIASVLLNGGFKADLGLDMHLDSSST